VERGRARPRCGRRRWSLNGVTISPCRPYSMALGLPRSTAGWLVGMRCSGDHAAASINLAAAACAAVPSSYPVLGGPTPPRLLQRYVSVCAVVCDAEPGCALGALCDLSYVELYRGAKFRCSGTIAFAR